MPPASTYAIEPPPAPIVSSSTIGIIAWYWPTRVSSRWRMRTSPPGATPMSADVPPTSRLITPGAPAARPAQMPPISPAIGPEKSVETGLSVALCSVSTPPDELIRCSSASKPRPAISLASRRT